MNKPTTIITQSRKLLYQGTLSLLVLLFLYAAASKGLSFNRFVGQLGRSPLFGQWPGMAAVLILMAELASVGLLFFTRTQRLGLWACLLLLLVFTLYILGMLLFSSKLPCSCGGIIEKLGWKGHVFFNLFFMALAAYGLHLHRSANGMSG